MHIAIGYCSFPTAIGCHLERALIALGHEVTDAGAPGPHGAGTTKRSP